MAERPRDLERDCLWINYKISEVGLAAGGLDANAVVYARAHTDDRLLPKAVIVDLGHGEDVGPLIKKLVDKGVWVYDKETDSYWVDSYSDDPPYREGSVADEAEAWVLRQQF